MSTHPFAPDPILTPYHAIRDQIRDGDLFFFRGDFRSSRLFTWLTKGYYSHATITAWWGDRLMIMQAEGVGIQAIPLSVAITEYPGRADWFQLQREAVPELDRKLVGVLDEARTDLGLKFGTLDLFRSLFRWVGKVQFTNPMSPRGLFCAEYVERCFRVGGIPLRRDAHGNHVPPDILCFPQDLAVSPLVRYQATVAHRPGLADPRTVDDVPVPTEPLRPPARAG
jgi:hypothetical protein